MTEQTEIKTLVNNNPSVFRRYGSQMGIIGVGLFIWFAFIFAAPLSLIHISEPTRPY